MPKRACLCAPNPASAPWIPPPASMCEFIHLYVSGMDVTPRFYFMTYYCPKEFMKTPTVRSQSLARGLLARTSAGLLLALTTATSALADVVYVTSEIQGCTATSVCGNVQTDGTYVETGITMGFTSAKGTATGRPVEIGRAHV